jgi:hypothetical protein
MKTRCYNENNEHYARYGERGIRICDRWLNSFENFVEDMGECPKGFTIERIDNNGSYEPGNCRWATTAEQNVNKRNNWNLQYNGLNLNRKHWATISGIPFGTLRSQLKRGLSLAECFHKQGGFKLHLRAV